MTKSETIQALWQAVILQKAPDMARYFTEDAMILWPNSGERFTLPEYLRANCEYPGAFPCQELLHRKKATVLDHDWLLWKRKNNVRK